MCASLRHCGFSDPKITPATTALTARHTDLLRDHLELSSAKTGRHRKEWASSPAGQHGPGQCQARHISLTASYPWSPCELTAVSWGVLVHNLGTPNKWHSVCTQKRHPSVSALQSHPLSGPNFNCARQKWSSLHLHSVLSAH